MRRGLLAGIAGASALALWLLLLDYAEGVPFRTPARLAGAFLGMESVEVARELVILSSVLHYAVFLGVGLAMSWLVSKTGARSLRLGLLLGLLLFELVFYTSTAFTGLDIVAELGWLEVLAGNLLAGTTLIGVLLLLHPRKEVVQEDQRRYHEGGENHPGHKEPRKDLAVGA